MSMHVFVFAMRTYPKSIASLGHSLFQRGIECDNGNIPNSERIYLNHFTDSAFSLNQQWAPQRNLSAALTIPIPQLHANSAGSMVQDIDEPRVA